MSYENITSFKNSNNNFINYIRTQDGRRTRGARESMSDHQAVRRYNYTNMLSTHRHHHRLPTP